MNTNYQSIFGFTIGPIYELMSHSQKTRELWFSSYFFSWYVKKFYEDLSNTAGVEIISPYHSPQNPPPNSKAGLFPDHIAGCYDNGSDACMKLLIDKNKIISEFFVDEIDKLGAGKYLTGKTKSEVETIFKDYIQTGFVVLPADKLPEGKNIVETMDTYLDALERNRSFTLRKNEPTCYRCKSLPSVFVMLNKERYLSEKQKGKSESEAKKNATEKVCPFCFFKYECHKSSQVQTEVGARGSFRYRSTGEISAYELINKIDDNEFNKYIDEWEEIEFDKNRTGGKEFRNLLPEKGEKIRPYHKYMAIVQADGDSLGDTANKAKNPEELSELLFEFGQRAHDITKEFQGEPIYIGGDDVLSFMPTAFSEDGNFFTVIDYIIKLSNAYKCKLNEKDLSGSMSFGVHLFYYKSPLSLAVKEARKQLNYIAKKIPGKDSLALLLTQHSGQKSALQFKFCSHELELFNTIMKNIHSGKAEFPHGIHHKLALYKTVLTNLNRVEQIEHFFKNRFNEEVHESFKGLPELQELLTDMLTVSTASGTLLLKNEEANKRLNEFLSMIRFIKFLIGEDK